MKGNLHCVEGHEAESALFLYGGSGLPISDLEKYLPAEEL